MFDVLGEHARSSFDLFVFAKLLILVKNCRVRQVQDLANIFEVVDVSNFSLFYIGLLFY